MIQGVRYKTFSGENVIFRNKYKVQGGMFLGGPIISLCDTPSSIIKPDYTSLSMLIQSCEHTSTDSCTHTHATLLHNDMYGALIISDPHIHNYSHYTMFIVMCTALCPITSCDYDITSYFFPLYTVIIIG